MIILRINQETQSRSMTLMIFKQKKMNGLISSILKQKTHIKTIIPANKLKVLLGLRMFLQESKF